MHSALRQPRQMIQKLWQRKRISHLVTIYFFGWTLYFGYFWSNVFEVGEFGDLTVGNVNIWGDWAVHLTMISRFAFNSLSPAESPLLIGADFSYPFFTNWIAGLLVRLGTPLIGTPVVLSFLASVFFIGALYTFFRTVLKRSTLAVIASCLFLLNGGLGFGYYFQDVFASAAPLQTALFPPREYTNIEPEFVRWISIINSMIIPQRAFTLGFPLALLILSQVYQLFLGKVRAVPRKRVLLLGVLTGLLTIIHTHSFLALFVILSFWMLADLSRVQNPRARAQEWAWLVASTAVVALPLISLFLKSNVSGGFFKWLPGWYAAENDIGWLQFWILNWGVTPFVAGLGFAHLLKGKPHAQQLFPVLVFAPFLLLFVLLNLFLFQPFIWDNTKLLVWSFVGVCALTTLGLERLWHLDWKPLVSKGLAVLLLALLVFAGTLDAYWVLRFSRHRYTMYSAEELRLAEWVRTNTPPESIWLTGDQHNHWLFNLTGRQTLMAYRGWLWTHGYDYHPVESNVSELFTNPNQPELIEKYGVDYAVVGPNERDVWKANVEAFREFPIVQQSRQYTVFQVRNDVR